MIKLFKYKGLIGRRQKKISGKIASENEITALKELRKIGIKNIKLYDKTPFLSKYNFFNSRIKDKEFAVFFEKLATQMEVGISPSKSLQNFLSEDFSFNMLIFINQVKKTLNTGASFTESMDSPNKIKKDIINLILIGEETGKIVEVLNELSKLYYENDRIKDTIKKSTYKPIGLLMFALSILIVIVPLLLKPIKNLQSQFHNSSGLPKLTQIVMNVTDFITSYWYIIIIIIIILILFHKYLYLNKFKYKEKYDNIIFNMPIFGSFNKSLAVYLTMLNLFILQKSGMPISKAFKMISDSQKNEEFKKDIDEIRFSLQEGNSLEESIQYSSYIPKIYKDMIKQGETTGKMVGELEKCKNFSESNFNNISEFVTKSFSTIISIFISLIIGIVIISVYMPIFTVVGDVMKKF